MPLKTGIDLGGTKIELIVLDDSGDEIFRKRIPTPQGDYPATLEAIQDLVEQAESGLGTSTSVGIGTPGAISKATGCLKNSNSTCLNGQPLLHDRKQSAAPSLILFAKAPSFAFLRRVSDGVTDQLEAPH